MGRPLKGSFEAHTDGSCTASLPVERGSRKRVSYRFSSRAAAERWAEVGIAALGDGRTPPGPEPTPTGRAEADGASIDGRHPIEITSDAWVDDYYRGLEKAEIDREREVRRMIRVHILPFFMRRAAGWHDLQRGSHVAWARQLTGADLLPQDLELVDDDVLLTVERAADRVGKSVATVRRWNRAGKLADTSYDAETGALLIPVRSLRRAGVLGDRAVVFMHSTAADLVWIWKQINDFGVMMGHIDRDLTSGLVALDDPPAEALRDPSRVDRKPVAISLPRCSALAAHLHPVHQMVMWLMRVLGLRISEAFGIHVGDLVDFGTFGLVLIRRQGGRGFRRRGRNGQVIRTDEVEHTKTAASRRPLVVPAHLMRLIRAIIAAYHTCPETGVVDAQARLVPGIQWANRSGQSSYRDALQRAFTAEGLELDLEFQATSHDLRKSFASDLQWEGTIDELVRRRSLGHAVGRDTMSRHYTLDLEVMTRDPLLGPLMVVATTLDRMVDEEIGELLVPSSADELQWGRTNPVLDRLDHASMVLHEAGLRVAPDGGDLCSTGEVAELLDRPVTTVRKMIARGDIASVERPDRHGQLRRYVLRRVAEKYRDAVADRRTLPEVAAELGLTYHQARDLLLATVPNIERVGQEFLVDDEVVAVLRAEQRRVKSLHRRAVRVSEAAEMLEVSPRRAREMVVDGRLELDAESDGSGVRFVTRASVEVRLEGSRPARVGAGDVGEDTLGLDEFRQLSGLSRPQVLDLVKAGLLAQAPGRACRFSRESVRRWAVGFRPDLLALLDVAR